MAKTFKGIKRKVVCVFGKWGKNTDFVIEPAHYDNKCSLCKDESFWIQEIKVKKKKTIKKV